MGDWLRFGERQHGVTYADAAELAPDDVASLIVANPGTKYGIGPSLARLKADEGAATWHLGVPGSALACAAAHGEAARRVPLREMRPADPA